MVFGRTGCPIRCPLYKKEIDYSKVNCPVTERIYDSEVIALGKDFLMYKENSDKILEAVYKNIEEIEN